MFDNIDKYGNCSREKIIEISEPKKIVKTIDISNFLSGNQKILVCPLCVYNMNIKRVDYDIMDKYDYMILECLYCHNTAGYYITGLDDFISVNKIEKQSELDNILIKGIMNNYK